VPSHRGRLAHLAAHRARHDARWDLLAYRHRLHGGALARAEAICEGLRRLGIDAERAAKVSGIERARADFAALKPLPKSYVHPPRADPDKDRAALDRLGREVARFRDPATMPPDLEKAEQRVLLAYVMARAAHLPATCDTVSDAQGLTPAAGKEDSSGPN
jgi:hypothetical protein